MGWAHKLVDPSGPWVCPASIWYQNYVLVAILQWSWPWSLLHFCNILTVIFFPMNKNQIPSLVQTFIQTSRSRHFYQAIRWTLLRNRNTSHLMGHRHWQTQKKMATTVKDSTRQLVTLAKDNDCARYRKRSKVCVFFMLTITQSFKGHGIAWGH